MQRLPWYAPYLRPQRSLASSRRYRPRLHPSMLRLGFLRSEQLAETLPKGRPLTEQAKQRMYDYGHEKRRQVHHLYLFGFLTIKYLNLVLLSYYYGNIIYIYCLEHDAHGNIYWPTRKKRLIMNAWIYVLIYRLSDWLTID